MLVFRGASFSQTVARTDFIVRSWRDQPAAQHVERGHLRPTSRQSRSQTYHLADNALHAAKTLGRDRVAQVAREALYDLSLLQRRDWGRTPV